ncbi:hypothetical protein GCM10019016_041450 [Streptomyces prasinosporus]|uniref:Uncharacterized protein n=1 Tax=Streptomyces prasinosporus TaxID=68256 RepID=A0ABP6TR86_9ACTN
MQLHREVPFVTVTEEIHTEIVNGHYALLQRAEEVHRRCTEALLGGGGAPQVLEILAGFTGNPVFLETTDGPVAVRGRRGPRARGPAPGVGGAARPAARRPRRPARSSWTCPAEAPAAGVSGRGWCCCRCAARRNRCTGWRPSGRRASSPWC